MAASLEDLARRVTAMAESSAAASEDVVGSVGRTRAVSVSQELFEVERSLADALRRLRALGRAAGASGP